MDNGYHKIIRSMAKDMDTGNGHPHNSVIMVSGKWASQKELELLKELQRYIRGGLRGGGKRGRAFRLFPMGIPIRGIIEMGSRRAMGFISGMKELSIGGILEMG